LDDIKGALAYRQGQTSDPEGVGVRALDDVTLEVELEGPTSYFPHLLTACVSYPVPRHVVEAHGEAWTAVDNIVANGPFRLEAWRPGQSAILARNPTYHGRFTGNVQRLEVCLAVDPAAKLALYEAGGLDIFHLESLPAVDLDRARHRHAGDYVSLPEPAVEFVGFDTSRPPFNDPRVRRAFVLATDRGTLVDKVLRGTRFPATGGYLPPAMPGHSAGIALPYDPDRARRLLAEAGYPGGSGFPAVEFLTDHKRRPWSEYFQAHWRENLGVEIRQEIMAWGKFLDRLFRDPPHMFCAGKQGHHPDPDDSLRAPIFQQLTGWQNRTYDRLVEEARRVTDLGRRIEMYQEADRILVEEAAIMPLTYSIWHLLVKPWVRRWPVSPTKFWFWKDVIIDPH
jgi:ABC-type oligopeptide transport system substrate-binding subunit